MNETNAPQVTADYKIITVVQPTPQHAIDALGREMASYIAEGYDGYGEIGLVQTSGGWLAYKEIVRYKYGDETCEAEPVETPQEAPESPVPARKRSKAHVA